MNPALAKLFRLQWRGFFRRMGRSLTTVRGLLYFLAGTVVVAVGFGPSIVGMFVDPQVIPAAEIRENMPLAIVLIILLNLIAAKNKAAISFSPAEIDFLFPGPFARRELLLYKLSNSLVGLIVTPLFLTVFLRLYGTSWIGAIVGVGLALAFLQLGATAMALGGQIYDQRAPTLIRRMVPVVVALLLVTVGLEYSRLAAAMGPLEAAKTLRHWPAVVMILAPLEAFGQTVTAPRLFPDLVGWALASLALDLAMLALVLRLDVDYLEAAEAASRKLQRKWQDWQRGSVQIVAPQAGRRVPNPGWLGGAGPIVWKQAVSAARQKKVLLRLLLSGAGLTLAIGLVARHASFPVWFAFYPAVLGMFAGGRFLGFDFRNDLDHLDWLKSLPLRPKAVVAGQLVVPIVLLTALQLVCVAVVFLLNPEQPQVYLAIVAFLVPLNTLFCGVDNLLFLLFPRRTAATTPGDVTQIGRATVEMGVKGLVCLAIALLLAGIGFLGYLACQHWVAVAIAVWLGLVLVDLALPPLIAWAFRRFDVSADTPP
jgi:hypothetical protein